jgi:hypothetical protein
MSSLRHSFIGLCLISSTISGLATIGVTASPVQAAPAKESKASQCKRLEQSILTHSKNMAASQDMGVRQILAKSQASIKQAQARKFSDPKIQRFHQQFLSFNRVVG